MARHSQEYWRRRAEQIARRQFRTADEYARELIREYRRAMASIQRDLEVFYRRFADNNDIVSLAEAQRLLDVGELEEFKMTLEEFIAKAKENADGRWTKVLDNVYIRTRVKRLEALQIQIQHHVEMLMGGRQRGMRELLGEIYTETYHRTLWEVHRGTGVATDFARITPRRLETALKADFAGSNWSARIWADRDKLVRELRTTLAQGFIRGDSIDRMTKALAERMDVSLSNAQRLVATETAFIVEQATLAGYRESGLVQEYEILATLDNRTSDICRQMDGKRFKLSEAEPGVTAPPFHPRCRTTIVPYLPDEEDPGERIARDAKGKVVMVPGDITYKEWQERFLR
ncbi:minor capsid protein [Symbiobacterium terraclitae]|uniref:minor capsid protein n=1 Tax=Symbiobacterium terraclitae TaxID=557451 RepID=UPI0035B55A41